MHHMDYHTYRYEENIDDVMLYYKNVTRKVISKVVHPTLVDEFATLIANSFFEEEKAALSLAESLDLDILHFAAYLNEKNLFQDLMTKKMQDEEGELVYEQYIDGLR